MNASRLIGIVVAFAALSLLAIAAAKAEQSTAPESYTRSANWRRVYEAVAERNLTVHSETEVTRTGDGRTWRRETSGYGDDGEVLQSTTTGEARRHADGTGAWTSNTQGTRNRPDGQAVDFTVDRHGAWQRTGDGAADYSVSIDRANSDGRSGHVDRTGTMARDENGRTWQAESTGSNERGRSWTGATTGELRRAGDGTAELNVTRVFTGDDGRTRTVEKSGTVTRTETGRSFDGRVIIRGDGDRPDRTCRVSGDGHRSARETRAAGARSGGPKARSRG